MFNKESISILKYLAAFGVLAALTACSDDGDSIVFNPDVPPQDVLVVSGDDNSTDVRNTISWTRDPAATDYVVYVSTAPGVDENSDQVVPTDSGLNWATHSGALIEGQDYYYRVQAVSGSLTSVLSDEVTGKPQASVTPSQLNDVAWNGSVNSSVLVAVGDNGTIISSTDGLTTGWTVRDLSPLDNSLAGVTWESTNAQFLVVGGGGTVLTSPDGSNWATQTILAAPDLEDVAWLGEPLGNRYIAVGASGAIWTSDGTGSNWVQQTAPPTAITDTLEGVTTNGTTIVAVGTNGTVLTSPDGSTWTELDIGETNNLNDVTWDGSQFAIVGSNDTVLTSPDGAAWTSIVPGTPNVTFIGASQWDSSIPADPILGAVGSAGTIIVSLDTVDGLSVEAGTTQQLNGMTWVDDGTTAYFVIVGNDGTVLTAQEQ